MEIRRLQWTRGWLVGEQPLIHDSGGGLGYPRGRRGSSVRQSRLKPLGLQTTRTVSLSLCLPFSCPALSLLLSTIPFFFFSSSSPVTCHLSLSLLSSHHRIQRFKLSHKSHRTMLLSRGSRALRTQWRTSKAVSQAVMGNTTSTQATPRWFTESRRLCAVKPVPLADIGEGEHPLLRTTSLSPRAQSLTPHHPQASSSARSSSGSSSPAPVSRSSPPCARSRATRPPSRSPAVSPASSRSSTTRRATWPGSASPS